jgi:16S rRNA processing protein RimM
VAEPAVVIGVIGRPHGVRGSVHAKPTGATLAALAVGEVVDAHTEGAPPRRLVLAARAGTPERPILSFEGVASREDAAALAGAAIRVPEGRVAAPQEPDTYFVRDLVGCDVLVGARAVGSVTAVHDAPANDVLEVSGDDGVLLVPFTADAVADLDLASRRIVVREDLFRA